MVNEIGKKWNLIGADKVEMKTGKATDKPKRNETVYHECNWGRRVFHSLPYSGVIPIHQKFNIECWHGEHVYT